MTDIPYEGKTEKESEKLVTKKERERDDLPRRVSANLVGRSCSDRARSAAAAVWLGGTADEAFTSVRYGASRDTNEGV